MYACTSAIRHRVPVVQRDPFFEAILRARQHLDFAADTLAVMESGAWHHGIARGILAEINQARALVEVSSNSIVKLELGVDLLEKLDRQGKYKEKKVRVPGKSKKYGVEAPSALQRHLFEANIFQNWLQRVQVIIDDLPRDAKIEIQKRWRTRLLLEEWTGGPIDRRACAVQLDKNVCLF